MWRSAGSVGTSHALSPSFVAGSVRDFLLSVGGRYEESDPLGLFGGQSATYAYAGSSPLNYIDWTGLAVDLNLFKPGTPEWQDAQAFQPIPGTYTVAGHGTPINIVDQRSGRNKTLTPQQLADLIAASKNYMPGETTLLLACNTGRKPGGRWGRAPFSQKLANDLNADVQAPNNWGWFLGYTDGSVGYMAASSVPDASWDAPGPLPTTPNFNDPDSTIVEFTPHGKLI